MLHGAAHDVLGAVSFILFIFFSSAKILTSIIHQIQPYSEKRRYSKPRNDKENIYVDSKLPYNYNE